MGKILGKISSPAAWIAAVAALLLSAIVVGLPIDSARADDNCATAPGAAPPEGQHWYYRTDRVKHRKCWYLHAAVPPPNQAAADPSAATPESVLPVATPQSPSAATPRSTNTASAAQPAMDTSNPPSDPDSIQPAPHITVLTVKTVTVPFVGTTSTSRSATPDGTGEPPMPQISQRDAGVPVDGDTRPVSGGDVATLPTSPDNAHNDLVPAAAASVPPQSAHVFLLLALTLGSAAALVALIGKMVGPARRPRLPEHPDDAWLSYRTAHRQADEAVTYEENAPFLAPAEPHGPVDLDAYEWGEQSPPAQADPATRPQEGKPEYSKQVAPTLKDIELALRVLRQVRQSITRT